MPSTTTRLEQIATLTEDTRITQYGVAIYRERHGGPTTVATTRTGIAASIAEEAAVELAERYPDAIVWLVTRTLVTPKWTEVEW